MKYFAVILFCAMLSLSNAYPWWGGNSGRDPGTAPVGNVGGGNTGGTWVGPGQLGGGGGGRDPGTAPVGNVGGGNTGGTWVGPGQLGGNGGRDPGTAPVGNVGQAGYYGVGNPNVYGQPGRL